ncbi:MAG: fimbrial protein [Bacteroidales bacterium]|nr:fimbrial protein [Bacteroidales bacterium]
MKTSIIALAACAAVFASCQKSFMPVSETQTFSGRFPVSVGVCNTYSGNTKALTTKDDNISSVQILVFRGNDIDAYGQTASGNAVTVSCTEGERTIYAVVNGPDCSGVATVSQLKEKTFSLGDNTCEKVIMTGSVTKTLAPSTEPVSIEVHRLLSRVVVKNIKRDMSAASLASMGFTLTACYLTNVPGNGNIGDTASATTWYNVGQNDPNLPSNVSNLIYDKISNGILANTKSYDKVHTFYSLPNVRSSKALRLVIEATMGEKTYYYPIDVPSLTSNQSYEISNVTIKRPGSDSPDKVVSFDDISFTVKVADWDGSKSVQEFSI